EDIIEEIVGNIYDEHDFISESSETVHEFGYIFDGDMLISDIEGKLGIKLSATEGCNTIGEFVQSQLSEIASKEKNDIIKINVGSIKVLSKTKDKIEQIELKLDQKMMKD
ncbi:MAG: hypothetical protein KAH13_00875, partial [Tenericutes bacterium]|nr:hypothetical protein [Mycoplasmatota bacterium]